MWLVLYLEFGSKSLHCKHKRESLGSVISLQRKPPIAIILLSIHLGRWGGVLIKWYEFQLEKRKNTFSAQCQSMVIIIRSNIFCTSKLLKNVFKNVFTTNNVKDFFFNYLDLVILHCKNVSECLIESLCFLSLTMVCPFTWIQISLLLACSLFPFLSISYPGRNDQV